VSATPARLSMSRAGLVKSPGQAQEFLTAHAFIHGHSIHGVS
jgi:hypothetical protein